MTSVDQEEKLSTILQRGIQDQEDKLLQPPEKKLQTDDNQIPMYNFTNSIVTFNNS